MKRKLSRKGKKLGSKRKLTPAQRARRRKKFVLGFAALGAGIAATAFAAVKAVKKKSSAAFRHGIKLARKGDVPPVAWALPAFFLAVGLLMMARTSVKYPITLTSAQLIRSFEEAKVKDTEERIAFWSEKLLHKPTLLGVFGRGPDINDTAPLFPPGYDCTTYVETVGALSRSENGTDVADKLIQIRYKNGRVSYRDRNHFPEADWIPNNEDAGNLRDITLRVARKSGILASFAYKDIDKYTWFKAQRTVEGDRAVAAVAMEDQKPVSVRLPYIPLEHMKTVVENIPQGSVINVVRENRKSHPVLITHQGFLIWKKGVPYFRHASSFREITEVPFTEYLKTLKAMPWRVVGFNIDQYK